MEGIWNLTDPDKFLQSGSQIVGVTKYLLEAYKIIPKQIDTLKIPDDLNHKRNKLKVALKSAKNERQKEKIEADIKVVRYYINNYLEVVFEIKLAVKYMESLEDLKKEYRQLINR